MQRAPTNLKQLLAQTPTAQELLASASPKHELYKHLHPLEEDTVLYKQQLANAVQQTTQQGYVVSLGHLKNIFNELREKNAIPHRSKRNLKYRLQILAPSANEHLNKLPHTPIKEAVTTHARNVFNTQTTNPKRYQQDIEITCYHPSKKTVGVHKYPLFYDQPEALHAHIKQQTTLETTIGDKRKKLVPATTKATYHPGSDALP